jgi:hypothetical protein
VTVTEWDQRQLCPDGGCTGLIGPEGLCRVCGRVAPNWGDERKRGLAEAKGEDDEAQGDDDEYEDDDDEHEDDEDGDDEEDEGDGDDGVIAAELRPDTPSTGDGDWRTRKLCSDGGCIGVIGDNGVCNVCGKKASS